MARRAGIDDKTIIQYIEQYATLNPNKKIKYVDIEAFIRKQGFDIKDGTIKKRKAIIDYIKSINTDELKIHESRIFAYMPLDIVDLSAKTHLTASAKEILLNRETSFKQIVESAVVINEENKRLRDLNKVLVSKNKALMEQIEKINNKEVTIASKDAEIKYYKDQLEGICLPEAFSIIVNNYDYGDVVSKTKLEEKTLTANKSIDIFSNDVSEDLMEGFDDDII